MASSEVIAAVKARLTAALPSYAQVQLSDYSQAPTPPANVDEFLCARFVGTHRQRGEIGGDEDAETNVYFEDGSFRIDVYVRINPRLSAGQTLEDRRQAVTEDVIAAFLGRRFDNVEVFSTANGLDLPAGAPPGWWGDSISCGFHFEHFGP